MNIKAIETIYNGYRFRSRLEARWAIFFDELGVKYQYELEGYELSNKMRYLPDFYIESLDLFIEIKPSLESISNHDIDKIDSFVFDGNKNLLLIIGEPTKEKMIFLNEYFAPSLLELHTSELSFQYDNMYLYWKDELSKISSVSFDFNVITWKIVLVSTGTMREWVGDFAIKTALAKAIRSRFELSEKKK